MTRGALQRLSPYGAHASTTTCDCRSANQIWSSKPHCSKIGSGSQNLKELTSSGSWPIWSLFIDS